MSDQSITRAVWLLLAGCLSPSCASSNFVVFTLPREDTRSFVALFSRLFSCFRILLDMCRGGSALSSGEPSLSPSADNNTLRPSTRRSVGSFTVLRANCASFLFILHSFRGEGTPILHSYYGLRVCTAAATERDMCESLPIVFVDLFPREHRAATV